MGTLPRTMSRGGCLQRLRLCYYSLTGNSEGNRRKIGSAGDLFSPKACLVARRRASVRMRATSGLHPQSECELESQGQHCVTYRCGRYLKGRAHCLEGRGRCLKGHGRCTLQRRIAG